MTKKALLIHENNLKQRVRMGVIVRKHKIVAIFTLELAFNMVHFEGCSFKPELPESVDLRQSRILLHCCCAPCSTAILEWMVEEGLRPGVFFSNSNIVPYEEYVKRRDELGRYASSFGLEVVDDEYDHSAWLEYVRPRAGAALAGPERGPRCLACFEFRLLRAARYAASHGYDILTTTLASSRWKDLSQVDAAGRLAISSIREGEDAPPMNASLRSAPPLASQSDAPVPPLIVPRVAEFPGGASSPSTNQINVFWWGQNWRKGGLQERRNFLIKSCALYNQTWCGCEFSQKD